MTNHRKAGLIIGPPPESHKYDLDKRGLVIRGHENKSLEAEEIIEQSSFQNELHQTRTGIQQTPTAYRRIPDRRVHRVRAGRRIIRPHPGRPGTVECCE